MSHTEMEQKDQEKKAPEAKGKDGMEKEAAEQKGIREWWHDHRPTTRRLAQLYCAVLYNAHAKGFVEGEIYTGKTKAVCVPGFNCYSCPGAVGACPLGSIQNALASSGTRAGFYVLGIIMLYGLMLGRTICGWLCPLGLVQELLHKIPTFKIRKSRITRALTWLKYVILAVFVAAIPLWYGMSRNIPLPGFCKYICPAGTFEGAMGLLANPANSDYYSMLGILFTRKFVIMLVIGLACIFCYRSFCRFICPLGAIYGLFNRLAVISVKVDAGRCNHCGSCVRSCQMDVRHVGDHECINCARCMSVCGQQAISVKAGKVTLMAPEGGCAGDTPEAPAKRRKMGKILWGLALALLCFALLWYNVLDPSARKKKTSSGTGTSAAAPAEAGTAVSAVSEEPAASEEAPAETAAPEEIPAESAVSGDVPEESAGSEDTSYSSDAPTGHEVGMQLADFSIECTDGSVFHLADTRGKVTFINLWATYCTPCVQELPHFSALYTEHEEDIAMLAVHPAECIVDVPTYLKEKDWAMPFAVDTEDNLVWDTVGGSFTMPQTIVLNRYGEVIYNQKGSVTPEMLEELYRQAAEDRK